MRDPDSGAVRTRVASGDLRRLIDERLSQPNANYLDGLRAMLLTSTDGASWSATDLSEIAGEPITQVAGVSHVGDQIVVRAQTRRVQRPEDLTAGTPTIFAQVVLTATPKR